MRDDDFAVGYCKPPKEHQFQPGQSGNPRGRPKGSQNIATRIHRISAKKVWITENGVKRQVPAIEASLLQLIKNAMSGNLRALEILLRYHNVLESDPPKDRRKDDAERLRLIESFFKESQPQDAKLSEPRDDLREEVPSNVIR